VSRDPERYVLCTACHCALSIETTADNEECPRCGLDTLTVVTSVIPEHCPTCGSVVSVVTADEGTSHYRPAVDGSTRPHLLTDEMVERAARAVHEVSDDVLPFDMPDPKLGRRHVRIQQKFLDERRERYLATARAALEAALGGAA
jgi:ribosomal protein S27AE